MDTTITRSDTATKDQPRDWADPLARAGYIAKGAVYTVVGVLAVQAAFGSGQAQGSRDAIREIGSQPFGQVLLGLTTLGLACYVIWRMIQAFADPDNKGTDAEGIAKRVGYFFSGIIYAGLAFLAARLALGNGGGTSGASQQTWTAKLLAQPFGPWLVGLVGVAIIGVGLYHFYKAYKATFMREYENSEMSARKRRMARRLGQVGLSARGVTFLLIGGFFIQAATQNQAGEVRGLAGAFQSLASQPYGTYLLAAVAIGFVAYGVYCFSRARYRRFVTL